MVNQYLTFLRRSVSLTTLAATLSWAVLVDALGKLLGRKPPHHGKVSFNRGDWLHILHLPSSINPLTSFHDLVSIICSNIVMIAAVFSELRFWDNHTWHSCSCSLYNLLWCSFLPYSSILCFFIPLFSFFFSFFHAGFHLSSISSPSIRMLPSSNWISTSTLMMIDQMERELASKCVRDL